MSTKISARPSATLPITGNETLGVIQVGVDKKITLASLSRVFNVRTYGAVGDGTTDDTAAFVAAIAAAGVGSAIYVPDGTYKITSQLTITQPGIFVHGDGPAVSVISFVPTGAATLFKWANGAVEIFGGGMEELTLYSPETTFSKVALDIYDVSEFRFQNIHINGTSNTNYWGGGAASIGIRTNGREDTSFRGVTSYADNPLVIATNPNNSISIDFFHFQDLYLVTAANNPCVTINDGVNLTNVTFDGFQSWARGTHGLYWNDTTSAQTSYNLVLDNIRLEQGADLTNGQYIYISHHTGLQRLMIRGFNGDDRKGFYFRKCQNVVLDTTTYGSGSKVGLDIDGTVAEIEGINTYWTAGSTASITGQLQVRGDPKYPNSGALPPDFKYTLATNDVTESIVGRAIHQPSFTLANNAVGAFTPVTAGSNVVGVFVVTASDPDVAIIAIAGGGLTIVSNPGGLFSTTATTPAKTNIYWDAGNGRYSIENKRGGSRNYAITHMGSYFAP